MIKEANVAGGRSRSVLARPLKRGTACMNCRFLKIKCDGTRPICGPCRRSPKDDPCEYTDGPARSRTRALEDTVQRLEQRLLELERPEASAPSITLHDPYPVGLPQQQGLSHGHRSLPGTPFDNLPRLLTPALSESQLDSFSPPPSTTASTPPFSHGLSPLGIFDRRVITTPESSSSSGYDFHDIQLWDTLIQNFLPHAAQFGFFLDPQRLITHTHSPPSPSASFLQRTAPALVAALCAFGTHLSTPRDRATEERFVHRAVQAAATTTDYTNPQTLLHAIQTDVVLAYYFWRTGAFLRARVHSANASGLAFGAGLHHTQNAIMPIITGDDQRLPPPADAAEAGERIRALWAVLVLQNLLAIAIDGDESPSDVLGVTMQVAVEVPWPREVDEYYPNIVVDNMVKVYLASQDADSTCDSINGLLVKAHLLLHRVVYMHSQIPASTQQQQQALASAFSTVEAMVDGLRFQLPSRSPRSPSVSSSRSSQDSYSPVPPVDDRVRLAHALLDATRIKLSAMAGFLYRFGYDMTPAITCAREMLRDAQGFSGGVASPIMGTLWRWATRLLVDELRRMRETQHDYDYAYDQELRVCVQEGLVALRDLAFMRRDLLLVQEAIVQAGLATEIGMGIGVGHGA
ncbi:Zn(2)-C6 fungal-type domain-containing protein [Mycena chlorophos]|uniref:Zn(2)-C6 fungal-type domain-containing protein n=1 Tax=Mycena chlorophos TaxID=658473 RepID=A0A8H6WSU7_MYCCL|nr:Zn(2)-C6 fungal-type domain-containing protein [Mycena chlorophos]